MDVPYFVVYITDELFILLVTCADFLGNIFHEYFWQNERY